MEYIVAPGIVEVANKPRWILIEDGFSDYLQLVDDFKANAGPMSFDDYVMTRTDPFALAIGDSVDGRCGSHALARAALVLQQGDWFTWASVDALYPARVAAGRPIPPAGVVWTTLYDFVRSRNRDMRSVGGLEMSETVMAVNQRQFNIVGPGACVASEYMLLVPGVYLRGVPSPTAPPIARVLTGSDGCGSICV
ncbi:unnamed protein product [Phytophthora lilii]|uniref:Unnamed protein product n=1 Tax=Phytophthora lilii TaxID=2077276 RepID=A0A9W6TM02_9STRA|nr:unnamed protein product [Phytophthora lilii]